MNTPTNMHAGSLEDIRGLARDELSIRARIGYVALLLVAAAMTAVVLSLWLTEPALPARTQAAFGVISLIGCAWVGFALWALTARRPLFARDAVIAGTLAVVFTSLFVTGALGAVIVSGAAAAFGALATGVVMLAVAVWNLIGARRRHAALAARRRELENALRTA
ncbi:MAG TPA: hypothetical protein VFO82_08035 [Steroidobacteraceae bacterium]|nr:hypothetical protein [Steroidobacteraceae bacterium]